MSKTIGPVVSILLLSSISFSQTNLEEIKAKAEESSSALIRGDYERLVDLTYPKLVEMLGGRSEAISFMEDRMKDIKARGFALISVSFDSPKEVVPIGSQLFAIVPCTMKMKAPGGVMTLPSYLLGISSNGSNKWTFVDASDMDEAFLKKLLPNAVGRLRFPKKQPWVFQRDPGTPVVPPDNNHLQRTRISALNDSLPLPELNARPMMPTVMCFAL